MRHAGTNDGENILFTAYSVRTKMFTRLHAYCVDKYYIFFNGGRTCNARAANSSLFMDMLIFCLFGKSHRIGKVKRIKNALGMINALFGKKYYEYNTNHGH